MFAIPPHKYKEPVLVSGTDGVGTKVILAQQLNRHDSIGIDLVAMCVNDILVQGAEPLFFLDYFASGKLKKEVAIAVIKGVTEGCIQAGAALIGGETAEMPDLYSKDEYDLAGFTVGVVERDKIIDGSKICCDDAIIGIASNGPHSNGYSLIRKVLEKSPDAKINGHFVSDLLLTPTRIYVKPILNLIKKIDIKGIAHITGGGITENIPRILQGPINAEINTNSWLRGPIFDWISNTGNVEQEEMRRTFNCGVGMVVVVDKKDINETISLLIKNGESAWQIGNIVKANEKDAGRVCYI
jgi:phosphoribosylformylglycinamidine cyclo-ligase